MYNHTIPAHRVHVISQSPFVVRYRFECDRTSDTQPPKYILVRVFACVRLCSLVVHLCSLVFACVRLSFTSVLTP